DGGGGAPIGAERLRALALRRCLSTAARRHPGGAQRMGSRARRREARLRLGEHRGCLRLHGRTPGRIKGLSARGISRRKIALSFRAPGSDGPRPPAARTYLVKQSLRPIRGRRGFRRAQTLCAGHCRFSVTEVGARITLTITDLGPNSTYYYAIAARDNVSGRLGPRSRAVSARTR
ncbi:MAG: hypothetical protein LC777_05495, partial [Actinobacteria bacterium]|nr:hypothetical protein [Actinomycetota bacterium]